MTQQKKKQERKKIFRDSSEMLHHVASTEYKRDFLYKTKNGRVFFLNDKLFKDNVQIAHVDRFKENLYVLKTYYNDYVGGMSCMFYPTKQIKDAFKHYTCVPLMTFNYSEAEEIYLRFFIEVSEKITKKAAENFVVICDTIDILSDGQSEYNKDLYKQCKEAVDKFEEAARLKREKEERERKEFEQKCYDIADKAFNKVFKTKDVQEILSRCHRADRYWSCFELKYPITKKYFAELAELIEKSKYYNKYFSVKHGWSSNLEKWVCPEDPTMDINSSFITEKLESILGINIGSRTDFVYISGDLLRTTRGVDVDDSSGLVRKLLKKFVACKTDKARERFIGLHVGSYVIRGWDPEQQCLQVGCHRFHINTLKGLVETLEKKGK